MLTVDVSKKRRTVCKSVSPMKGFVINAPDSTPAIFINFSLSIKPLIAMMESKILSEILLRNARARITDGEQREVSQTCVNVGAGVGGTDRAGASEIVIFPPFGMALRALTTRLSKT